MPVPNADRLTMDGMSPEGNPCPFFIDRGFVDQIEEYGPQWRFDDLSLLCWAVQNPCTIFAGLNRPELDDGYAYCCLPQQWVASLEEPPAIHPIPEGLVLVVYVRPVSGGLLVFDFAWRHRSEDNPCWPYQHDQFTGGVIWPSR